MAVALLRPLQIAPEERVIFYRKIHNKYRSNEPDRKNIQSRDILKVGHHGSAYGSTPGFVAAVRPRYAIVSVGRHNLFGHPAPATIATLQRFGATIYRTDEDGAIAVETDGTRTSIVPTLP